MKRSQKIATGIALSLSLGFASAVHAHPGQTGGGMGPGAQGGMQHGGMRHGAQAGQGHGGMQHGMKGSMQYGKQAAGPGTGPQGGHGLMTPEERTALREKMRNAATPEERHQIAAATRAEMQKRAQEKGITLPEGRGPRTGAATQAPATTEHAH
jgi:hypothetical protein